MANSRVQTLDNITLFDDQVRNTTKLVLDDSETASSRPGMISKAFGKLQSVLGPLNFVKAAATKTSRIKNFVLFLMLACVLFLFALSSLPMVLMYPENFALLFSLASLVMHLAMSYLKPSTEEYIQALVSNKEFSTITTLYFVSLFFTVYSSAYLRSYVIVLAACGMQMATVTWYLFTMFPRGSQGFLTAIRYSLKICPCGPSTLPI